MQELRARNLRQADRRHVAGIPIKALVHLLIDALGLERDLIEMAATQHVFLAMQALRGPLRPIFQLALRFQRVSRFDEQFQGDVGVGDNAEVRTEHAADLGRLDVDVNEFATLACRRRSSQYDGWPSDCRCRTRNPTRGKSRCRSDGSSAGRPCPP